MRTSLKNGPLRIPSHAVVRPSSRWGPAPFPHAPPPSEIATRFVTNRIACTLRHCPLSCHFIPVHYTIPLAFGESIPGVQQGHINAKLDKWWFIDICPITETGDLQCRLRCRSICLSVGCTTRALPFLVRLQELRGQLEGGDRNMHQDATTQLTLLSRTQLGCVGSPLRLSTGRYGNLQKQ